jgi:serine/threonine protein kinase
MGGGIHREKNVESSFLSEYTVHDYIGSGTVAVVRRATRISDGRELALKCISSSDDEVQQFAKDEYELLESLKHPSIVQVLNLHVTDVQICIAIEFCDRGSLQGYVEECGIIDEVTIKPLFRQFLQVL